MSYLDDLGQRSPESDADLLNLGRYNALAAILKRIGYTYVHLESGHAVTNEAPLADRFVEFRRSGTQVLVDRRQSASSDSEIVSRKFSSALARTHIVVACIQSMFPWPKTIRSLNGGRRSER